VTLQPTLGSIWPVCSSVAERRRFMTLTARTGPLQSHFSCNRVLRPERRMRNFRRCRSDFRGICYESDLL
jgi:hypothetical protein